MGSGIPDVTQVYKEKERRALKKVMNRNIDKQGFPARIYRLPFTAIIHVYFHMILFKYSELLSWKKFAVIRY